MSLATTRMLPSVVSFEASFAMSRARSSSVTARDEGMFQKISTREDVLFTCCPPAPEERETRTSSSLRGIATDSFTMSEFAAGGGVLIRSAPAEKLERREERDESPDNDDQHLRRYRREGCPL